MKLDSAAAAANAIYEGIGNTCQSAIGNDECDLSWLLDACVDKSKTAQFALLITSAGIGDAVIATQQELSTKTRTLTLKRVNHYKFLIQQLELKLATFE